MHSPADRRFDGFLDFWPHYLREHARPATRRLHFVGTLLALVCLVLAVAWRQPWWLLLAPIAGYGAAWIGHFVVEGNRPATFKHPWWSMRGDLRMFRLTLIGGLASELRRAGLDRDGG